MFKTQTFAVTLLVAAMLAATAAAQTFPGGGSIGVTASDNVRLTVFNAVPPSPVTPSCTVTAALVNVTPASAVTGTFPGPIVCPECGASQPPLPVTLTLAPGGATTIDYSPVLAAGLRQQLRGAFTFKNLLACAGLAATAEVFDRASGRTTILSAASPVLPLVGPAGITNGDTIRLNLLPPNPIAPPQPIAPPNPCRVQASFLPLTSTVPPSPLAQSTFTLLPGQPAALEFSNAGLAAGTRQMVLPVLKQLSGLTTCLGVTANLELYDSASARTFAFTPPSPILPALAIQ
jgi:hypothetical protein